MTWNMQRRARAESRGSTLVTTGATLVAIVSAAGAGDPCGTGGSCFEAHAAPGCSQILCCESVCGLDPFCCELSWDVACAETAGIVCPPPVVTMGLPHTALGNANLATLPNGSLQVSNLGSTGNDGVRVELGNATGLGLDCGWATLPTSGAMTLRQLGPENQLLGTMTVTFGPETFVYEPDFSAQGSATYTLTALLEGEVVLEAPGLSGAAISHAAVGFSAKPPGKWKCFWKPCAVNKCGKWGKVFDSVELLTISGVGTVVADGFSVTPTDSCDAGTSVAALEVLGSDLGTLQIDAEYLELFTGIFNQPLGGATMVGADEALVVSPQEGSSGPFGVRTWPGAGPGTGSVIPTAFAAGWEELSEHAHAGSTIRLSSTGR
ncbi:MAG: hypothetical protein JNL94_08170, partial [Planctomycetes bacterium]|nr:hypothetical protein [Planctomycetota bacterium]